MSAPRRSRRSPLVAVGAAVSLAGLGFYLYQRYSESLPPTDHPRNDSDSSKGETSQSSKKKFKPSLSMSLPMTFLRTTENMMLLEKLLSMLSQYYLVTLIAPPPSPSPLTSSSSFSSHSNSNNSPHISGGGGVESVAALSHSLSKAVGFDSRRILEYSKEEGRLALARALACDAHCETMIEAVELKDEKVGRDSIDGGSDGDSTPRATSPAPLSNKLRRAEDEKVSILERYHADMAQIRKSSSLLIFLLLPIAASSLIQDNKSPRLIISDVDVETIIQPFLLPGQQELSSRVPGVKVVDERRRSTEAGITEAWTQAAKRVGLLSKGWQ